MLLKNAGFMFPNTREPQGVTMLAAQMNGKLVEEYSSVAMSKENYRGFVNALLDYFQQQQ